MPRAEPVGDFSMTGASLMETPGRTSIEVGQSNAGMCAVLENAALLYASGQSKPARDLLEQGVQTDADAKGSQLAWLALFDLQQRTDDRAAFDKLALLYVVAAGGALPSALGVAGVIAVGIGVLLVRGARGSARGLAFGVTIAAAIAGYTVVDRYGIRHAAAGPYLLLVMVAPALVYTLLVGRGRVRAALDPATVVIGAASASAYLLVLLALRLASAPAVAAVRETSVVIATGAAAVFLGERVSSTRLAGAAVVVLGVALLAFS